MNEGNNVNGLDTRKFGGNNWITTAGPYEAPTLQDNKSVNFDFQKVLDDKVTPVKEQAIENVVAGSPLVEEPLHLAETPFQRQSLLDSKVTDGFTVRDEMMSKLGMMDEKGNYTDTYTNYINKGGTPLPGYEQESSQLLKQERYDSIFEQVSEGKQSYESALMEAYGADILETMGYKVNSVGWWMSKYLSHDYSNPMANRYLMDQVLQAADEYHQSRLASEWAKKDTSQLSAAGLIGQEVPAEKIDDLFPDLGKFAEDQNLSDLELRKMITSGRIDAQYRLISKGDGTYYYLHTDGQLYLLDNKAGDNHGSVKLNADGTIKEISLNSTGALDFARHFAASATSVFTGLAKICAVATSGVEAIFTDKSWGEALSDELMSIDSFLNDSEGINWLTDTGHIDMDGFKANDISDWMFALTDIAGMVAGGMALGQVGGLFNQAGSALTAGSTSISGAFAKGTGTGMKYLSGKFLTGVGNLAARSTGMYQGAKGFDNYTFSLFGKNLVQGARAPFLNHLIKTVPVYAVKDFYGTVASMNAQKTGMELAHSMDPYNPEVQIDETDIIKQGLKVAAINAGFSAIFAGGVNDNQTQRMKGLITGKLSNQGVVDKVTQKLVDKGLRATQENILKECGDEVLKQFIRQKRNTIAANTIMDLMDNFFTMNLQDSMSKINREGGIDSTGKLVAQGFSPYLKNEDGTTTLNANMMKNVVQSLVMTMPTLRGQLATEEYNVALNSLNGIHKRILAELDDAIAKSNNDADKSTLRLVKTNYIKQYQTSKAETAEGKIMSAISDLSTKLSDGKDVPAVVKNAVMKEVSANKVQFYQALADNTRTRMELHKAAIVDHYKDGVNLGTGGLIKRIVGKAHYSLGTGLDAQSFTVGANKLGVSSLLDGTGEAKIAYDANKIILDSEANFEKAYYGITKSKTAHTFAEDLKIDERDINLDNAVEFTSFDNLKEDTQQKVLDSNIEHPEAYTYFRIKNEAATSDDTFNDRMRGSIFKASLSLLSENGTDNTFVTKIDNDHYAVYNYADGIEMAMTFDALYNFNKAFAAIKTGQEIDGIKTMLSTLMGDDDFEAIQDDQAKLAGQHVRTIIDTAVKNNVLDLTDAASVLNALLESDDNKISKAVKIIKKETELNLRNTNNFNDLTDVEKAYKVDKAINEINTNLKSKKLIESKEMTAALNLIIDQDAKDLSKDVKAILKKAGYTDDQIKATAEQIREIGKRNGILPLESDTVKEVLQTLSLKDAEGHAVTNAEDIKQSFRRLGLDPTKEQHFFKLVTGFVEDINKKTVQKNFKGNIVAIDFAHIFGEEYNKQKTQIINAVKMQDEKRVTKNAHLSNLAMQEIEAQQNIQGNKQIVTYDLNDPGQRQDFINVAKTLNIFEDDIDDNANLKELQLELRTGIRKSAQPGVLYSSGLMDVVEFKDYEKVAEKIMTKLAELKPDMYELDPLSQKVKKIDSKDYTRQTVQLMNLSSAQAARYKTAVGDYGVLPYNPETLSTVEQIQQTLKQTEEQTTKSGGTIGGQGAGEYVNIPQNEVGKQIEQDPNLSKYFAIRQIIDTITSDPNSYTFRIANQDGIEDKLDKLGVKEFYDVETNVSDNYIVLRLKHDADLDKKMYAYLDNSKKFNLFTILPFLSSEPLSPESNYYRHPDIQGGVMKFDDEETQIPDMHFAAKGIHGSNGEDIFDISFSWDTRGKLKNELLFNLFKNAMDANGKINSYKYNPFDNTPTQRQKSITQLLNNYNNMLEKVIVDNSKHQDYRAWLNEEGVLKELNDMYQSGELEKITPEQAAIQILNKTKVNYIQAHDTEYDPVKIGSNGFSYSPVRMPGSSAQDYDSVTASALLRAANKQFDPIEGDDFYAGALKDMTDAVTFFKTNIANAEQYQTDIISTQPKITLFSENPVSAMAFSLGGNEGYVNVQDIDWVADMNFEQFRTIFDNTVMPEEDAKALFTNIQNIYKTMNDLGNTVSNKAKQISQYKMVGAATPIVGKDNPLIINTENPNAISDIKKLGDLEYNKQRIQNRKTSTKNLQEVTRDNLNFMSKRIFDIANTKLDKTLRNHFATPTNVEVLDLQNKYNMRTFINIEANTKNNINQLLTADTSIKATDKQVGYLAAHLENVAMGTNKYTSEYDAYQIITKDGLNPIASITKARNPGEVRSELNKLGDLKGTIFLEVDKHDLQSQNGITFSYKILNTDEDINELKSAFLSKEIDSMYYRYKDQYDTKEEYFDWIKDLARKNPDELNNMLDDQARHNLSKKTLVNIVAQSIENLNTSMNKEGIKKLLVPKVFNNPDYNIAGLNALISNNTDALLSEDPDVRANAEMAIFGISNDGMSDIQRKMDEEFTNNLKKQLQLDDQDIKHFIDEAVTNPFNSKDYNTAITRLKEMGLSADKVAEALIVNSKDGASLFYKLSSKQKLTTLEKDTPAIMLKTFDSKEKVDIKELRNILNGEVDGEINVFDIEGDSKNLIRRYTPDEMFQIAIKKHSKDGTNGPTETYFVLHKDTKGNIILPKQWVKEHVGWDTNFVKNNKGYREAVKQYLSYDEAGDNKYNFVTLDELQEILGKNKYYIAYNGDNYDFKILSKIAPNNKYIDALANIYAIQYPGDNPLQGLTQEEVITRSFIDTLNKTSQKKLDAHNATADVDLLDSWLIGSDEENGVISTLSDNTLKSKMHIRDIVDNIADIYGIEDKQSLYKKIDRFFDKGADPNEWQQHFSQDMVDASATSEILRYLNYLEKDDIGRILWDYEHSEIYKQLNTSNVVKDIIEHNKTKYFAKGIAKLMAEDTNITASQAFNTMINIARNQLMGNSDDYIAKKDILNLITDESFIDSLNNIDEDNKDYNTHYKNMLKNLGKGVKGNKDTKYGLNTDIKAYEDHGELNNFINSESTLEQNLNVDDEIKDYVRRRNMHPLIATDESVFDKAIKLSMSNHLADKFADIADVSNLDAIVATKVHGIYKMLAPFNPEGEPLREILPSKTKKGSMTSKSFIRSIAPNELVLTKRAAELINGGRDISTLFDDNGEAWVYSLAYPSDKQNHLSAHKLRIVEGDEARIYATPLTIKVLRARDFDGDFMTVFNASTPEQRAIAKISAKYAYAAHAIQEDLAQYSLGLSNTHKTRPEFVTAMQLASQPDILKICQELDDALKNNLPTEDIETKLRNTIKLYEFKNLDGESIYDKDQEKATDQLNKIVSYLGINKDKGDEFVYVANPLLGEDSFSKEQKKRWILHNASTYTNLMDSTYGFFKKNKLNDLREDYEITNPLTQLNQTDIYMTDTLMDGIKNIQTQKQSDEYFDKMSLSLQYSTQDFSSKQWSEDMSKIYQYIDDTKKLTSDFISNKDIDKAQEIITDATDNVLYAIEYNVRHNTDFNKEVLDIMNNNVDTTFEEVLNHHIKLKNLKDSITAKSHHISKMMNSNDAGAFLVSELINDTMNEPSTKYVTDISKEFDSNKGKVAVLIDELSAGEDAIYVNKNTHMKQVIHSDLYDPVIGEIPDKLFTQDGPVYLTAEQLHKLFPNESFKDGGYITEFLYWDPSKSKPEYVETYYKQQKDMLQQMKDTLDGKHRLLDKALDRFGNEVDLDRLEFDENRNETTLRKLVEQDIKDLEYKISSLENRLNTYDYKNYEDSFVKNKNNIIGVRVFNEVPLGNKKIFNIGKGVEKLVDVGKENTVDFDFAISANIFKDRKLGLSTYFENELDKNLQPQTIYIKQMKNGKVVSVPRQAIIFDNVPTYVALDDTTYNTDNPQRLDAQTFYASRDSLPALGIYGSALYENKNGHFYHTDEKIKPLFEDAETKHTLAYTNAVQQIQTIRADLLAQCIDDFNLWNAKNKNDYFEENEFNSKKDIVYSALHDENLPGQEFQGKINSLKNFIISNIGKEKFNEWLETRTPQERLHFSPVIEQIFTKLYQGNVYFTGDQQAKGLITKAGRREATVADATVSTNKPYNQAEVDIQPSAIRDMEYYYFPFDEYYALMNNGYRPNDLVMISQTAKGNLGYRKGIQGAPTLEGSFKPVDSDWTATYDNGLSNILLINDYKNGQGGAADIRRSNTLSNLKWTKQKGDFDASALEYAPDKRGLYWALANNNIGEMYAPQDSYLAYMLYNIADKRNVTNVDKAIATNTKNIDRDINLNILKNTYSMKDGTIDYVAKPYQTSDTFENLKAKDKGELNLKSYKYSYFNHKEIFDKYKQYNSDNLNTLVKGIDFNKEEFSEEDLDNIITTIKDAYSKSLGTSKFSDNNIPREINKSINFTWDYKGTSEVFKESLIEGSGLKIVGEDTANVAVGIKNYAASAEYAKVEASRNLSQLNTLVSNVNKKDFEDFCVYNWLNASKDLKDPNYELKLKFVGTTDKELSTTLKDKYNQFASANPQIVSAYNNYINSIVSLAHQAESITHEPFGNLYTFLAPFMSNNKDIKYGTVQNAIRSQLNFANYDPTIVDKKFSSNMMFNFFDSGRIMISDLSKIIGIDQMASTLRNQRLLDNVNITNKAYDFITENVDVNKLYVSADDMKSDWYKQIHSDILKTIQYYTDLDIDKLSKGSRNSIDQLKNLYLHLDNLSKEQFEDLSASVQDRTGEILSLSSIKYNMEHATDALTKSQYETVYNTMWAKIIVAQRLAELNPRIINNVNTFLSDLTTNGYTLCNKFGQKISMDSPIKPLADGSLSFISDNTELYYNNHDVNKFAQYVLEKALSGDIYVAKSDMVDMLEKRIYTRPVPSKFMSFLQDISKTSASIQMAMPAKMLSRLARFTGFDYAMAFLYSPNTVKYMGRAQRELMNAVHTQGASLEDNEILRNYLMREGQPLGMEGKDPVTFSEDLNTDLSSITSKLTSPLAIQNHLGRYAIYLAALEGFNNNDPWYGPAYIHKNEIDSLQTNEDKAMFVMDYLLGSPGGFPYLSKKTSGLMMYATFPMNLTRTLGAWGMSVGRLATEGFTEENSKQWMRDVAWPSVGVAGITLASAALIEYICDLFGVDDETKKKWKKEGVTIDPLATIVGGTPSVTYDSINPIKNLEEMFISPFTSEYNDTVGKKVYGLFQNNILGKLNPAIKVPIEIATQHDLFGNSLVDTSYKYNYMENAMRKTLGFFIGSGVADNVVDQYKFDSYNDDSTFGSSLWTGLSRGINADLGNQKSWKKRTSNYYAAVNAVRNYAYFNNDNGWNADTENLTDADWLDPRRSSTSKYGEVDQSDYKRINNILRKMIKNQDSPEHVYSVIVQEYNNGVSEATLRRVLNNNSLIRKLNNIDKASFYKTLSDKELQMMQQAILFEQEMYPLLQEFFPTKTKLSKIYLPKYYRDYIPSSGSSYVNRPRTIYPNKTYSNSYSKKKTYYNNYSNNYKFDNNTKVSPQMGIWDNNYNKIEDLKVPDLGGGN